MRTDPSLGSLVASALLLLSPVVAAGQSSTEADSALAACAAAAAAGDEKTADAAADAAERLFRQRLEARPDAAEARVGLAQVISQCRIRFANVFSAGRMVSESNRLLEEALEIDPANWGAHLTLGLNHYYTPAFLGRTGESIRQFETLLELQGDRADAPHFALPYLYLGDLYERAGRKQDAAEVWRRGSALFPANADIRERLEKAGEEERPAAARYELPAVTVRARRLAPGVALGGTSVDRLEVVTAPGGTADLLQAIRMQGGVTQATDGSDLFVRGGEPAESPVFLDGGRILYPGTFETLHGGLFGVLSPAVLREALFFSGGFSARYGNALSGVLDVTTEGRPTQRRGSGGVSLAGANLTGFTPLGPRAGAWAAMRVTDATLLTWMQGTRDDFPESPRSLEGTFGAVGTPRPGVELKATAVVQGDGATRWVEGHGHAGGLRSRGGTRIGVLSVRASRPDGRVARLALSASERTADFRFGALDREGTDRTLSASLSGGIPMGAITVVRAGTEAAWFGAEGEGWMPTTGSVGPDAPRVRTASSDDTRHLGAFVEVETSPARHLSLVAGLRTDLLPGEEAATLDPRLSAAWRDGAWTLRLGGGIFQQGRWRVGYDVPDEGTPGGLPRRARHLAAGVERDGATPLRVEAYLKEYDRFVPDGIGPRAEGATVAGVDARSGWSVGSSLSGWVVYSFLRGRTRLEDGSTVPSRVDVTHGVTAVGKWAVGSAWELGATVRYATGRPFTPVLGASPAAPGEAPVPVLGAIHGERLPAYARMDARLTHLGSLGGRGTVTYVELLNYLGRRNVMGYSYDEGYARRLPIDSFFARPVVMVGMEVQLR